MKINSSNFDIAAGATILSWSFFRKPAHHSLESTLLAGGQAFVLTAIFNRIVRAALVKKSEEIPKPSIIEATYMGFLVPGIYCGILRTTQKIWILPRFLASFCVTSLATATIGWNKWTLDTGIGISLDTNALGIALFREIFLRAAPTHISQPALLALDSTIYVLHYLAPEPEDSDSPFPPVYSREWTYLAITGVAESLIMQYVNWRYGLISAVAFLVLGCVSGALPEN